MATTEERINALEDKLDQVDVDRKTAHTENNDMYAGLIRDYDKAQQDQIAGIEQNAAAQKKLQQQQTDFAISKINSEKVKADIAYQREQSGAYVDWQKESNKYGVNAEQTASMGMANTGYSESSQVSMYNTYQLRVAKAREAHQYVIQDLNNAIREAKLANDSAMMQIALDTYEQKTAIIMQGLTQKQGLLSEQAKRKMEIDAIYDDRYKSVLDDIYKERTLAEEIRQYNEKMAEEKRQFNAQMKEEKRQFDILHPQVSLGGGGSSGGGSKVKAPSKRAASNAKKNATISKSNSGVEKAAKVDASDYLNALISSGASKDKVSNEIALALRNGAISKKEAQNLRSKFTPRGIQY